MKKILSLTLALCVLFGAVSIVSASALKFNNSIDCGDYWYIKLDENTAAIGADNPDLSGTLVIPDTINGYKVTEIATNGFNHTNITTVVIPETVTKINDYAFKYNPKLERVIIPEGVTTLGEAVFAECPSLKSITIPASVTDMGFFSVGYKDNYVDNNGEMLYDGGYDKVSSFTINGYKGTAAEAYAEKDCFLFVDITPYYKDKVLELLEIPEEDPENGEGWLAYYREGYRYYASDENREATPDFVLIETYENISGPAFAAELFGDYVLQSHEHRFPATFGYFIYLPEENEIYSLQKAFDMGLEGVYNVFTEGKLGRLMGDVNKDRRLTIQDATLIQKALAGLEEIENDTIEAFVYSDRENIPTSISDFNRDKKLNIRDATAIQKRIAGYGNEKLDFSVLSINTADNPNTPAIREIADTPEELDKLLRKITDNAGVITFEKSLDEKFFEEKSIVVIAEKVVFPANSEYSVVSVLANGATLNVRRSVYPRDFDEYKSFYQYILIEVNKSDVASIAQVTVNTELPYISEPVCALD